MVGYCPVCKKQRRFIAVNNWVSFYVSQVENNPIGMCAVAYARCPECSGVLAPYHLDDLAITPPKRENEDG